MMVASTTAGGKSEFLPVRRGVDCFYILTLASFAALVFNSSEFLTEDREDSEGSEINTFPVSTSQNKPVDAVFQSECMKID